MEDFKPVPPMESWEEIEKQLDIDDVWQNISADLEHVDKGNKIYNLSKISELGVLIAILLWFFVLNNPGFKSPDVEVLTSIEKEAVKGLNSISTEPIPQKEVSVDKFFEDNHEIENSRKKVASKNLSKDNATHKIQSSEMKRNDRPINQQQNENGSAGVEDKVKTSSYKRNNEVLSGDSNNLSAPTQNSVSVGDHADGHYGKIEYLIPLRDNLWVSKALLKREIEIEQLYRAASVESSDFDADIELGEKDSIAFRRGLSVGISGSIKNHWLLNNTTYRGLSSDELTTTLPSFGKNFGVLMAYDVSSRIVLQAELVYSEEGQSYKDYIGGKYQKKTTALAYSSVSAIAKYRLHPLFAMSNAASSSVLLGIYYGRLQKAEEILEDNTRGLSHEYKDFDVGIFIGYEYEYKLFKSFVITPGVRFRYGLTNIYSGDGRLPSSMNITKNGSLDLNIALKYNFSLK